MDSFDSVDTTIVCGLCMSESQLEDYSTDNPFYHGVLFCDDCILEMYKYEYYDKGVQLEPKDTNSVQEHIPEPDAEQEEVELEMLTDEWYYESLDDADESFDLYEHFGIPSDIPESMQDALLEAAMGSS